jgi:hypothetical protein
MIDGSGDKKITITTGLGVSDARLRKVLQKTKGMDVKFQISGESTGELFELIRYGVTWKDFQDRVKMIEQNGNKIQFISTISNLSILGFADFYDKYHGSHKITLNNLTGTDWMMPHVLDTQSKIDFIDNTKSKKNLPEFKSLLRMIKKTPDDTHRVKMASYLSQFSSRRGLNIGFLPMSFLKWVDLPT